MTCLVHRTFRVGVGAQRRPQGAIDTQDTGAGHAQQAWHILDGQVMQHGSDDEADLVRDFDNCRCLNCVESAAGKMLSCMLPLNPNTKPVSVAARTVSTPPG